MKTMNSLQSRTVWTPGNPSSLLALQSADVLLERILQNHAGTTTGRVSSADLNESNTPKLACLNLVVAAAAAAKPVWSQSPLF